MAEGKAAVPSPKDRALGAGPPGSHDSIYHPPQRYLRAHAHARARRHLLSDLSEVAADMVIDRAVESALRRILAKPELDSKPGDVERMVYFALRSEAAKMRESEDTKGVAIAKFGATSFPETADADRSDVILQESDFATAYRAAVKALPTLQRQCYRAYCEGNLTKQQVADKLERSKRTVEDAIDGANVNLRKRLGHFWEGRDPKAPPSKEGT